VAQDTTRYGTDIYGKPMLSNLLSEISRTPGLTWLRFLYSYPSSVDRELMATMLENENICRYLDIPVQHIHDDILRRMRRKENGDQIRDAIAMIRDAVPEITLRSTVIVGFPGEDESHFRLLLRFLEETEFDHLGVFMYSPEEGTASAAMADHVPDDEKLARLERVAEMHNKIAIRRRSLMIDTVTDLLIEGFDRGKNMVFGRMQSQAPEIDDVVYVNGIDGRSVNSVIGDFVSVRITGVSGFDLLATTMETADLG
jgi:ribosomal protein S12 methylthiotransferase